MTRELGLVWIKKFLSKIVTNLNLTKSIRISLHALNVPMVITLQTKCVVKLVNFGVKVTINARRSLNKTVKCLQMANA